ncbi:helix-turn-helix domain-containing protein [Burkholderia cepacia]|uniref:helix-turn-helix domain-containing protein n=1 Tax=Burkholderia cepacia TaxID=292 RepID=UPI000F5F3FAE|nr:helix-turn-helix domain-containing protein [Burkholderia cepacia]MCA8028956.1 helix-turn-helix domain-containing protein [Burkholderia cepacia]RRA20993.1 helix-turn-helix domain-containing protein [Burkholderia cepacia]
MEADLNFPTKSAVPQPPSTMPFAGWRDVLDKNYGLRCEPHRGRNCDVGIHVRDVGDIRVADVRMNAQTLSPRSLMETTQDQLYMKLVLRGIATFEQNGEQRRFSADSLVIVDPARPFFELVDEETQLIVVTCPKASLRQRGYRSQLDHWIAPDMGSPDVQIVHHMIKLIAGCHSAVGEQTRYLLSTQVLDLMDVLLTRESSSAPRTNSGVLFRVKRYIAEHLGDESLDANAIASGVHLSVSHLNRLFGIEGTSLMRYVWNQRLERAYQLLNSSGRAGLRIEDVAWHCGFSSAAHFSRLFKQHFGRSPRHLRDGSEATGRHGSGDEQ